MSAAAATSTQRSRGQVAPAPTQIRNDDSQISAEQAEAMRRAEEEGEGLEAERTLGVYEEKKAKIGKITKKAWCIIDPRTSKFVTYWDAIGMSALIFTAIVTAVEVSFVESPGCIDGLFLVNRGVDVRRPWPPASPRGTCTRALRSHPHAAPRCPARARCARATVAASRTSMSPVHTALTERRSRAVDGARS